MTSVIKKNIVKLFSYSIFRKGFKFTLGFVTIKLFVDLIYYMVLDKSLIFPRFTWIVGRQCPLNPPLPMPYLFPENFNDIKKIRQYNKVELEINKQWSSSVIKRQYLYTQFPMRQNPSEIDVFVEYANNWKRDNLAKLRILKLMKQQGIEIPQGANQKIRSLQQPQLDQALQHIVPQL